MKTTQELYNERLIRIKKAIALEKPDKTPAVFMGDAFCAIHQGVKISDFCMNPELASQTVIKSLQQLGNVDGINLPYMYAPLFYFIFFTRMKFPGRELPENALWQLEEAELMTEADYDTLIEKGYDYFFYDFMTNRLNLNLEEIGKALAFAPQASKNCIDAGFVEYTGAGALISLPIDVLCGGRSMTKFVRDLRRMPDKVEAAMDVIQQANIAKIKQLITTTNPLTVFIAMARGATDFYSTKLWERFVWRYLQEMTEAILEAGSVPSFHVDSNWERGLEYYRAFPKAKCVFETDGVTDIYKIKEAIGDRMCIKGDVPAGMLTVGTPDEVYNYVTKLKRELGPGYIVSSGCSCPPNAKVENVKAMIAAAGE